MSYYYSESYSAGPTDDILEKEQKQTEVDLEKLALEKYPIQMVAKDPFDDEDDTKEDLNEYERDAYLQGLKVGYELGLNSKRRIRYD